MDEKELKNPPKKGKKSAPFSRIYILHYVKLTYRSALLILGIVLYIIIKIFGSGNMVEELEKHYWALGIIWIVYTVEMCCRFFPSKLESPGCQKQFKKNYIPTGESEPQWHSWKRTFAVALSWFLLNGSIGALYYLGIIDEGILIIISLAYGVCDMICILFFCPFQTWFMKNRCCTVCRIYNWDFAMMFTPFIFFPHLYSWSLLFLSLALLIRWEMTVRLHPERFSEKTNACISCKNCEEKLCHHKKQLRGFWAKNKERLLREKEKLMHKKENPKK